VVEPVPTTRDDRCCHHVVADGAHILKPGQGATPPPIAATRCWPRRQRGGKPQWRQGPGRGRRVDSRARGQASIERPASPTTASSDRRVQQRHIAPPYSPHQTPVSQPINEHPTHRQHRQRWQHVESSTHRSAWAAVAECPVRRRRPAPCAVSSHPQPLRQHSRQAVDRHGRRSAAACEGWRGCCAVPCRASWSSSRRRRRSSAAP
jgi:hypothetical protein